MEEKKKINKVTIAQWIFALIGLSAASSAFKSGFIGVLAGLVLLASAFVVSPLGKIIPVFPNNKDAKTIVQFALAFALFSLGAVITPSNKNDTVDTSLDTSIVETESIETNAETEIETVTEIEEETETTTEELTETTETIAAEPETMEVLETTEQETDIEADTEGTTSKNPESKYVRKEELNGRGKSDSGRSEPKYVNVIGYAAVYYDEVYNLTNTDKFNDTSLWKIPTYEKDKQFWNETQVTLPHKTEIVVLDQFLEHKGFGWYKGYLLVEKIDDGSQYYIDVDNFITKPYWDYTDDLGEAASVGCFVAEFNQVSDYYPTVKGEKVELNDGAIVFVKSGNSKLITATVWKEWEYGYGGIDVFFQPDDLTLIY